MQIQQFLFCAKFAIETDLFLLELDLFLDLPLAQHLRLEVLGHVGDRGVEGDAQKIHEMLEGARTDPCSLICQDLTYASKITS